MEKVNTTIDALADEALDAACLVIQNYLEVKTGDLAGIYFSDNQVKNKLMQYIEAEVRDKIETLEQWFDDHPETEGHEADYDEFVKLQNYKGFLNTSGIGV
jgi:hypothetical protein